jgi:hypothetical protein
LKVSFLPTFLTTLSVNGTTEELTFYERCLFSFCDRIWFSFSNYSNVIALSRSRNWRVAILLINIEENMFVLFFKIILYFNNVH